MDSTIESLESPFVTRACLKGDTSGVYLGSGPSIVSILDLLLWEGVSDNFSTDGGDRVLEIFRVSGWGGGFETVSGEILGFTTFRKFLRDSFRWRCDFRLSVGVDGLFLVSWMPVMKSFVASAMRVELSCEGGLPSRY